MLTALFRSLHRNRISGRHSLSVQLTYANQQLFVNRNHNNQNFISSFSTLPKKSKFPFPLMGSVVSSLQKTQLIVNMDGPQAQFVRDTIASHKVVIFSKSYCPYCSMAKEQFRKLKVEKIYVVELDQRSDGSEIQAVLGEMTGARTVPRCFINGKFVGGGTDVKRMYEQGVLQKYFE